MRIDWLSKLQHLLQVLAFCLAVAALQYAFAPERPYAPMAAYSLSIGPIIWAIIDLGRHLFPSARETGWPKGIPGMLLIAGGIGGGYFFGTQLADALCRTFGWYAGGPRLDPQRELLHSVLITVVAGSAASYYFYSRNRSEYLERKMDEARRHADEARLKLLEAQLEPHMLFNTLANLRALIGVDPAQAQQMLDRIISFLRATLSASRSTTQPLEDEFTRLQDYLELMAIRMGPRLAYALELAPDLARHPVPSLLLQPLVENSILHGLEPKVEGGRIEVRARRDGDALMLEVQDSGVGSAAPIQGRGFGLTQVRERLATLHGGAATLQFESQPGTGTCATIRLPLAA